MALTEADLYDLGRREQQHRCSGHTDTANDYRMMLTEIQRLRDELYRPPQTEASE